MRYFSLLSLFAVSFTDVGATIANVRYQPDLNSIRKTYEYDKQDEIAETNHLR